MAEEESDQEAERLGEELVAIVESPPGPAGLRAASDGRGGAGGGSCGGGGVGISSRDYCRRFCQVRRPSAARPDLSAVLGLPASPTLFVSESGLCPALAPPAQRGALRMKLPPPPIRLGVGGGERVRDDSLRFRVAEKVRVCPGWRGCTGGSAGRKALY